MAFKNMADCYIPTVGLHSPNERVAVNFGATKFAFDIAAFVQARLFPLHEAGDRANPHQTRATCTMPWGPSGKRTSLSNLIGPLLFWLASSGAWPCGTVGLGRLSRRKQRCALALQHVMWAGLENSTPQEEKEKLRVAVNSVPLSVS